MPYLIYAPETPNEKVYELKQGFNTLGRKIDNTIVLLEETVSRYHAQIHVAPNGVTIKDCGSSNHTFVNQVKVTVSQLRDGDHDRLWSTSVKIRSFSDKISVATDQRSSRIIKRSF